MESVQPPAVLQISPAQQRDCAFSSMDEQREILRRDGRVGQTNGFSQRKKDCVVASQLVLGGTIPTNTKACLHLDDVEGGGSKTVSKRCLITLP